MNTLHKRHLYANNYILFERSRVFNKIKNLKLQQVGSHHCTYMRDSHIILKDWSKVANKAPCSGKAEKVIYLARTPTPA